MKKLYRRLRSQQGIVLAGTLVILSALVLAGVGGRVMLRNDHRTVANLRGATEAFYLAASGLEWSKNELLAIPGLDPTPADRTIDYASGRFSVFFISTVNTGRLSAQYTVRSLGSRGSDAHGLQARLTKVYDLSDSAVGLRGNIASVQLGTGVRLSAADHNPTTGEQIAAAAKPVLSSDVSATVGLVDAAIAGISPGTIESAPASGLSPNLPSAMLAQLATDLCNLPAATRLAVPEAGVLAIADQSWGTLAAPQLRCIDGLSSAGDAASLSLTGAGLLIVRNADLVLTGAFRWDGLILVTGDNVALRASGAPAKTVFGGMLVNETGTPSPATAQLDIQGNFRAAFSRIALSAAANLIGEPLLAPLFSVLPATLYQDYWRSLSS